MTPKSKSLKSLVDLTEDPHNANKGTLRGEQLLETSLKTFGAGRSIVVDRQGFVIGGNKTLAMAREAGLAIRVVKSNGMKLVVVRRTDLDLDETPQARVLAYLDNRAAEVGLAWDAAQLEADLAAGVDLGGMFTEPERLALLSDLMSDEVQTFLLRTVLEFETAAQQAQWAAAVAAIAELPGEMFPDKLDLWLDVQLEALHAD